MQISQYTIKGQICERPVPLSVLLLLRIGYTHPCPTVSPADSARSGEQCCFPLNSTQLSQSWGACAAVL